MAGTITKKRLIAVILFSIVTAVLLVVASHTNRLPAAPDKFTYDWRTYLLTERAKSPRDDIVLIIIDERSLTGYSYVSPVDRGLVAELINLVDAASPKAIGVDLIFDRPTEPAKDEALLRAIRRAKARVILAALDDRAAEDGEALDYQEAFFAKANRPAGHIFFGAEANRLTLGDQAVRYMLPPSSIPPRRRAFARLLADVDGEKSEPKSELIFWRLPPAAAGAELFPTFPVPAHRGDNFNGLGLADQLASWREALAGKIVLIGGAFGDRDLHHTPLTVATQKRVHGIEIHAQILAQLRDERSIHEMPHWAEFLLVASVAATGFFAAQRWNLRGDGWRSSAVAFVVVVSTGLLLFWTAQFILPSATLFLGWAAGLFAGHWAGKERV